MEPPASTHGTGDRPADSDDLLQRLITSTNPDLKCPHPLIGALLALIPDDIYAALTRSQHNLTRAEALSQGGKFWWAARILRFNATEIPSYVTSIDTPPDSNLKPTCRITSLIKTKIEKQLLVLPSLHQKSFRRRYGSDLPWTKSMQKLKEIIHQTGLDTSNHDLLSLLEIHDCRGAYYTSHSHPWLGCTAHAIVRSQYNNAPLVACLVLHTDNRRDTSDLQYDFKWTAAMRIRLAAMAFVIGAPHAALCIEQHSPSHQGTAHAIWNIKAQFTTNVLPVLWGVYSKTYIPAVLAIDCDTINYIGTWVSCLYQELQMSLPTSIHDTRASTINNKSCPPSSKTGVTIKLIKEDLRYIKSFRTIRAATYVVPPDSVSLLIQRRITDTISRAAIRGEGKLIPHLAGPPIFQKLLLCPYPLKYPMSLLEQNREEQVSMFDDNEARFDCDFKIVFKNWPHSVYPTNAIHNVEARKAVYKSFTEVVKHFIKSIDCNLTMSQGGGSGVRNIGVPNDRWGNWIAECHMCGRNKRVKSQSSSDSSRFNNRAPIIICGAKVSVSLHFAIISKDNNLLGSDTYGNPRRQRIDPTLSIAITSLPNLPHDMDLVPYLSFNINYDHQHHLANQLSMQSRPFRDDLRLFASDQFRSHRSVTAVVNMLIERAEMEHLQAWNDTNPGKAAPLELIHHAAHMDGSIVPSRAVLYAIRRKVLSENGPSTCKWEEFSPSLYRLRDTFNATQCDNGTNGFIEIISPCPATFPLKPKAWGVVIVTPMMVRTHKSCPQSGHTAVFDGTHNVVRDGEVAQYTAFVPLPCGALPLFHILSNCKDGDFLGRCVGAMKGHMARVESRIGRPIFFGQRGASAGPHNFMTDYAPSEYGALLGVYPSAQHYLCLFHLLKAVDKWLKDKDSGIRSKETRDNLYWAFCGLVDFVPPASTAIDKAVEKRIDDFYNDPVVSANPAFALYLKQTYLSPKIRVKWMTAYRRSNPYLRGINTSNHAEANFRVEKYEVMSRIKSFSPVHHVSFLIDTFEEYLAERVLNSVRGSFSLLKWLRKMLPRKDISSDVLSNISVEEEREGKHGLVVVVDKRLPRCPVRVMVDLRRWRCYNCCDEGHISTGCVHRLVAQQHFPSDLGTEAPPHSSPLRRFFYSWLAKGDKQVKQLSYYCTGAQAGEEKGDVAQQIRDYRADPSGSSHDLSLVFLVREGLLSEESFSDKPLPSARQGVAIGSDTSHEICEFMRSTWQVEVENHFREDCAGGGDEEEDVPGGFVDFFEEIVDGSFFFDQAPESDGGTNGEEKEESQAPASSTTDLRSSMEGLFGTLGGLRESISLGIKARTITPIRGSKALDSLDGALVHLKRKVDEAVVANDGDYILSAACQLERAFASESCLMSETNRRDNTIRRRSSRMKKKPRVGIGR